MGVRRPAVLEAQRRVRRQLQDVLDDLRNARLAAGLPQAAVGRALGVSHQQVSFWEGGSGTRDVVRLAQWAAVLGLEVSVRAFAGGSPLRDAGQLRVLERARAVIGEVWSWSTEVPVTTNQYDRRAFDAVLTRGSGRVALEVITRLTDAQSQVRAALLKQEAGTVDRLILVLAQTRRNRAALAAAAPTLRPSFPAGPRSVLAALRLGHIPDANGIALV